MRIGMRQPRWAVAPVAAGLVLLLLLGAIGAGLRLPGLSHLSGLPGFGVLDYRTLSGGSFLPLRPDYLDELLGTGFGRDEISPAGAQAVELQGTAGTLAVGAVPPLAPVAEADSQRPPVVLDHAFTNDDFDRAVVVPSLPFTARTSTAGAGMQEGEPTHCSKTGGTAWYRYTPSRTHMVFADTFGTNHATAIGVFRGPGPLRALEHEACGSDPTGNASVGFTAQAGATYYVQVISVVQGGPLVFHLSPLGTTSRVPTLARAAGGQEHFPAISGTGRFVAFTSLLAPTCPFVTCDAQLLLVDRRSGAVTLISRARDGRPGNGNSAFPSLSHDGRYVGFSSNASDLVAEDTNAGSDYFVHDTVTGQTVRASVSSAGAEGRYDAAGDPNYSTFGSMSPDGRYAAFGTRARGLTADDQDDVGDIFVRDLSTGITTRESVAVTTTAPRDQRDTSGTGELPMISWGGRYLMFRSWATDLVAADYGDCRLRNVVCANVFVRDRQAGRTELLSRTRAGKADNQSARFSMSYDGRLRAWTSLSSEIVPGDTNAVSDAFVHDQRTGRTVRVSVSSSGEQQNDPGSPTQRTDAFQVAGTSRYVSLSADGRHVAFDSRSTNLVPKDNNRATDIFVHDLRTGATSRVSVSSLGEEGNADSLRPALSADGQVVVFQSDADNLAPGDDDKTGDIYVHERRGA